MTKVVINCGYGGFGLSKQAIIYYANLKNMDPGEYDYEYFGFTNIDEHDIPRDDPALVRVVEELGKSANSDYSSLGIAEVPVGVEWHIEDYDGCERVAEDHRIWYAKRI